MFFNRTMEKGAHGLVKQTRQCCIQTTEKKKKRSVDEGRPAVSNNYSSDSEGLASSYMQNEVIAHHFT